jgi:Dolichyl-phosphate-mannose-protein mannosyltransferase
MAMPQPIKAQISVYRLCFALLSLFFLGTTILWLHLDQRPPAWDDGYYQSRSLILYDALTSGGLPGFAARFLKVMGTKPPLIAALPTPVYLVLGRNAGATLVVNLVALLALFGSLYWMGKHYASPRAGLLAAFVAGTMPMTYGLARHYLVECGLVALVAVALCLMADSERSGTLRWSILLGATCALGVLMKFSFPAYVLIPAIYFAIDGRGGLARPKAWLGFAAAAAVLAMPWYLVNFGEALRTALQAGSGATAQIYGTGDILSAAEIWRYGMNVANTAPRLYVVVLVIALPLVFGILTQQAKRGLLLCALWSAPILFLTFSHYRDLRYAAPLFPALALALGILLDAAIAWYGRAAIAVTVVLLALPAVSMLQTSFGILGSQPLQLFGLLFDAPRFSYARAFNPAPWPHQEILQGLYRRTTFTGEQKKLVVIGTDSGNFNADNFGLAILQDNLPLQIATTAYQTDPAMVGAMLNAASFFLYKEGGEGESPLNSVGEQARQWVRESGNFAERVAPRKLPDGGTAHVFERVPTPVEGAGARVQPAMDHAADCHVTFGGKIELTGLSADRTADAIEVKYRWRSLHPADRDYWCFTHIVDSKGKIAGYLDHAILDGNPAMSTWKTGDVQTEILRFAIPAGGRNETYHLRLGVFDRPSGERLQVTDSSFAVTDGETAVVTKDVGARK